MYYKGLNLEELNKQSEAIKQYNLLISKDLNLYRQNYCGCVFSIDEGGK